jgi:dihydroflavonol-4-reductase
VKVTVTGASGHLGANLVRGLLARGDDVRAATIESPSDCVPGLQGLEVERVHADVRDAESVRRAVAGADLVFHLAAKVSIARWEAPEVWATNARGTRNVVDACLDAGVGRLVHMSSISALDPRPGRLAVLEDRGYSIDHRLSAYDRSKAAGEQAVADGVRRGLDAVVLNPTGMLGPWDTAPSLIGAVLLGLWNGRYSSMVQGGMNWVDVRDVANAALAASQCGRTGERYLVGGSWVRVNELMSIAARTGGVEPPSFTAPMWLARLGAPFASTWYRVTRRSPRFTREALQMLERYRLVLDARAYDELDHRPRPIERTLEDTYAWFCERGLVVTRSPGTVPRRLANAVPSV